MRALLTLMLVSVAGLAAADDTLSTAVEEDYQSYLWPLFDHFHRNPELSTIEFKTAARMADELRQAGFEVTENVGGTGVVAMLPNGDGPLVMMRADMDGLPVQEKSGLENASQATQVDPLTGNTVATMHACGHDVHITSLVGTARYMANNSDRWGGTLMLVVQPAEERGIGARAMREDGIYERFGTPDYAFAFHVSAGRPVGAITVQERDAYAGVDSVDIIVHGIGAHGASPHRGKDPVLIGSQIVIALQTLVSRELAPRTPGVVTVGSFHSGTKHNIISDRAVLQLTVRNTSDATRQLLLEGIERIAVNVGRAAGLPEDKLPEVIVSDENVPPTLNTPALVQRLRGAWSAALGEDVFFDIPPSGMGGEDFPYFTRNPDIPTVYWQVGGTARADMLAELEGGPAVPSHHSPLFKIEPEESVRLGVESTVIALLEMMGR